MSIYDRILVPTDGSPEGRRAVSHAIELATVHDSTVCGLYVINTVSYNGLPMETSWESVTTLLQTDSQAALDEVVDLAEAHGVPVETELAEGSPSTEITQFAEAEDCDLIVMGTHGRGGIDRLLLGSVAEKVVRSARVPVLTVRVGDEATETAGPATADSEATTESPLTADSQSN